MTDRDRDWGAEAHQAAIDHLDVCDAWEAYYEEGEPEGARPAGEHPAMSPYCGCQTCMVREVLSAAWPVIEEAVRSGDLDPIPYQLAEQVGPWTSHGHAIPGVTVVGDRPGRPPVARCGGPRLCAQCALEAGAFLPGRERGTNVDST